MNSDASGEFVYRPALGDSARWILEKWLGRGGASVVWQARELDTGRRVALKVLAGLSPEGAASRGFGKEVAISSRLNHPAILRVFGMSNDDSGRPLIEMELAEGGSLAMKALKQGGFLSWEELHPLALQLCDALSHAHDLQVIHRDIKPANLLLDGSGSLKLADFGCATLRDASRGETSATVTLVSQGTLAYMSPQQLNGEKPSPADDIYAAGATLHALLAGRPPFHTGYLAHQILTLRPPSIESQQRDLGVSNPVPPGVARVIAAALEKNPARRPASAAEFRKLMEKGDVSGWVRRHFLAVVVAGGVAATVGIAGLAISGRRSAKVAEEEKAARLGLPRPDKELLTGASSPDGSVWVGGYFTRLFGVPRDGLARLARDRSLDTSLLPVVGGAVRAIAALPDGAVLVGGDLKGETKVVTGNLALLKHDGQLDRSFRSGCDWTVLCLAPEPRGGVLVGGLFRALGGLSCQRLARLGPDLRPDPSFNPGADGNVHSIVPLLHGGSYVGGRFLSIAGQSRAYLAKLEPDGRLDRNFAIDLDGEVSVLCLDREGRLLVGGMFRKVNGASRPGFFRVDRTGAPDPGFNPSIAGHILTIVPLHDGSAVVGGEFHIPGVEHRACLARISAEGVAETFSEPRPDGVVLGIVPSTDGHLLVGGKFTLADGRGAENAVWAEPSLAGRLKVDGETGRLLWQRASGSALLHGVVMEWSPRDGVRWTALPAASWEPGGWSCDPGPVPVGSRIRARGRICGGIHNGSASLIEARCTKG